MVETAAHRCDHALPPLPVRQWVVSVRKSLRYLLQEDAARQGTIMRALLAASRQESRSDLFVVNGRSTFDTGLSKIEWPVTAVAPTHLALS